MSLTITTDVFCDGPGCVEWTHGTTGPRADPLSARQAAARFGWVRRRDSDNSRLRDLCPRCAGLSTDPSLDRDDAHWASSR